MNFKFSSKTSRNLFVLIFLAYAFSYIGRKLYGACMEDICLSLCMTKRFAGYISTGYLLCYGVGQLVFGFVSDHVSPKKLIALGLFGAGLCNILTGVSSNPIQFLVFWSLNACFQSMLWSPTVRAIALWIPHEDYTIAGTNIGVALPVGTLGCYLVSSFSLKFLSWRFAFAIAGIMIIVMAVVWLLCNNERAVPIRLEKSKETKHPLKMIYFYIITCGTISVIFAILCNGILKDGMTDWISSFLSENYFISSADSALLLTLLPITNISGNYIATWIDKHFTHNELSCSGILFFFASICVFLILISKNAILSAILFAFVCSLMGGINNELLTFIPLHFADVGASGFLTGLFNSFSYFAAAASGLVAGSILEISSWTCLIVFWALISALGIPICFIGSKQWERGKKNIQ